jgi:hypothetical protein
MMGEAVAEERPDFQPQGHQFDPGLSYLIFIGCFVNAPARMTDLKVSVTGSIGLQARHG